MTAATFRAHCAQGHDRIDFAGAEGAKAFELHMRAEHKRSPYRNKVKSLATPYQWKAPKAPADTRKLTAVLLKYDTMPIRFADEVMDWWTEDKITADELQAGDTFALKGTTYSVQEITGDTFALTMVDGPRAVTSGKVNRSAFDKLGGDVVLLKRAS